MKERPILFNGAMVRAIREGRKTVTRRPVKGDQIPRLGPDLGGHRYWSAVGQHHPRYGYLVDGATEAECAARLGELGACPYGQVGDRLWVRETFADIGARLTYRADLDDGAHCLVKRWTPSLHMPRAACRLLLEITAVRVERLQAISLNQVRREGCEVREFWLFGEDAERRQEIAAGVFRGLWESTGGDWSSNPWVWVVEFRPVPAEALAAGAAA